MTAEVSLETSDRSSHRLGGAGLARRIARGGVLYVSARLLTQAVLWPITFIVARLLQPADYGIMTSGLIFVGLTDMLTDAGLGRALVQKKEVGPRDLAEGFTISVALAAIFYGLLFLLAQPVAVFLDTPELVLFLRILALTTVLIPIRTIPWAVLQRDHSLGTLSAINAVSAFVQAAAVLGLAIAGMGYWSLVVGVLSARASEAILFAWFAGWRPRLCIPGSGARPLVGFCFHMTLSSLLWYVYSNADFAVAGKLLGQTALGFYALAFQLMSLPVQKLTDNVNHVIYPVYCRLQNDRPLLRDMYLRLTVLLSVLGTPILTGMALVASDAFVLLLGVKWIEAIRPFQMLCFVGALMVVMASFPPLLSALGRPDLNAKGMLANAVLLPAGFLLGGWWLGLGGICLAWMVLYPLLVAGSVHFTRKTTGITLGDLWRVQMPIIAAVLFMIVVVFGVRYWLGPETSKTVRLLLSVLAGIVAYSGFLLGFARHTVVDTLFGLWRELRGREPAAAPGLSA
jgi:O-antigen/teichoic acid export membrane protein